MLTEKKKRDFANGTVYLLETEDGYPIETTDTFLPYYTKDAVGRKQNTLDSKDLGSRADRWMIGVSTMSGCPVRCKFCATGKLKRWRSLDRTEILAQVVFILNQNGRNPHQSKEFKINYTRMGEPFLNLNEVRGAVGLIDRWYPDANTHHYVSTIGVKDSKFYWIQGNTTLQLSVHSLDPKRRDWLIPYNKKMTLEELGQIRSAIDSGIL